MSKSYLYLSEIIRILFKMVWMDTKPHSKCVIIPGFLKIATSIN